MVDHQDRILTTHIGSLIRPAPLRAYIRAIESAVAVNIHAYEECLQSSINEVIAEQKRIGIDIVSDGEFGKFRSWSYYILERLEGIEERNVEAPPGSRQGPGAHGESAEVGIPDPGEIRAHIGAGKGLRLAHGQTGAVHILNDLSREMALNCSQSSSPVQGRERHRRCRGLPPSVRQRGTP